MGGALKFRPDGTFTIVQFTDLHVQNGEPEDLMTFDLMERTLKAEKPDLIVFTGDLIYSPGCRDPRRSLRDAVSVAERSGIPWAAVFGNHDSETAVTREELFQVLKEHPGCLAERGPSEVHGVGNYVVRVEDGEGRTRAALYFLDSGERSEAPSVPGYDWIRRSQIEWFADQSKRISERCGGGVPSLVFFHIPVPEYEEVWKTRICHGHRYEQVACPQVNSGFFAAMAEQGDVLGTFCGHDHVNDYSGDLMGIRLCYGRASGYQTYGRKFYSRGARVIRLKAGERAFESWIRLHNGARIVRPRTHRPWGFWLKERLRKLL